MGILREHVNTREDIIEYIQILMDNPENMAFTGDELRARITELGFSIYEFLLI